VESILTVVIDSTASDSGRGVSDLHWRHHNSRRLCSSVARSCVQYSSSRLAGRHSSYVLLTTSHASNKANHLNHELIKARCLSGQTNQNRRISSSLVFVINFLNKFLTKILVGFSFAQSTITAEMSVRPYDAGGYDVWPNLFFTNTLRGWHKEKPSLPPLFLTQVVRIEDLSRRRQRHGCQASIGLPVSLKEILRLQRASPITSGKFYCFE
jgi:hypothetical protein